MAKTIAVEAEKSELTETEFAELSAELTAIEGQVSRFRARLNAVKPRKYKTFGDLRGVLAGTPDIPYEVFQEAKYHFTWEGEDIR